MLQLTNAEVTFPADSILRRVRGALFPKKYKADGEPVLKDITLWLGRGESFALIGPPGAGKTTLLRLIAGRIPITGGHCSVEGRVMAAIREEDGLLPHETGEGNVLLCCRLMGMKSEASVACAAEANRLAKLEADFCKPVREYDAGMRARLMMGMALCVKPDMLVVSRVLEQCGFPYDTLLVEEMRPMIKAGMTLLMESADLRLLSRLCESALWMEDGALKRIGLLETVYTAYTRPEIQEEEKKAKSSAKEMLRQYEAAFSEPLAPGEPFTPVWNAGFSGNGRQQWPEEAKYALAEAENLARRLNAQITAYARANMAYEEELQRMEEALKKERARAKAAEREAVALRQQLGMRSGHRGMGK